MLPLAEGTDAGGMLLVFGIIMTVCGVLGGFAWRQKGGDFWVGFVAGSILTWLGWVVLAIANPKNASSRREPA